MVARPRAGLARAPCAGGQRPPVRAKRQSCQTTWRALGRAPQPSVRAVRAAPHVTVFGEKDAQLLGAHGERHEQDVRKVALQLRHLKARVLRVGVQVRERDVAGRIGHWGAVRDGDGHWGRKSAGAHPRAAQGHPTDLRNPRSYSNRHRIPRDAHVPELYSAASAAARSSAERAYWPCRSTRWSETCSIKGLTLFNS